MVFSFLSITPGFHFHTYNHCRELLRPLFVSAACGENKPRVIVPRVIVPRVIVPRVIVPRVIVPGVIVVEEKFKEHNLLSS